MFDSIGGASYSGGIKVPIENCVGVSGCGPGTFNSHWREGVFFNELMTGYLNSGVVNPLSALTLAAMQDLGYTVNMSAAEPYMRTFSSPPAQASPTGSTAGPIDLGDDQAHIPIHLVNRRGRVAGVIQPR